MKVYLASSWRNQRHGGVLTALRAAGHEVYDFKAPGTAFSWGDILAGHGTPDGWTPRQFRDLVLKDPRTIAGFDADMHALDSADATVLLLPCGRSAHLELGFAIGMGQRTVVLLDQVLDDADLMHLAADHVVLDVEEALAVLREPSKRCRETDPAGNRCWNMAGQCKPGGYHVHQSSSTTMRRLQAYLSGDRREG